MVLQMPLTLLRFNSMKVRLKRCGGRGVCGALFAFQFHEGPIKTCFGIGRCQSIPLFQFHEGPIKTQCHHGGLKVCALVSIP